MSEFPEKTKKVPNDLEKLEKNLVCVVSNKESYYKMEETI